MPASRVHGPVALLLVAGLLLAGCGSVGSNGSAAPAVTVPTVDTAGPDAGGDFDSSAAVGATTSTASLPDPCSLLSQATIGATLEASEPMYQAAATTTTTEPATQSGHGLSCRILWSVKDSAQGVFSVEVQPAEDWDLTLAIDDDPAPIDGVAGAERAVEVIDTPWAKMPGGYSIGILGAEPDEFGIALLKAAAQNAP